MAVIDKINRRGISGKRVLIGPGELVGPKATNAVFSSVTRITGAVDFYEITDGSGANEGTYTVTVGPYSENGLTAMLRGVGEVALVRQVDGVNTPTATAAVVAKGKVSGTRGTVTLGPAAISTTDRLFLVVQCKDKSAVRYQLTIDQVEDRITISGQPPNRSVTAPAGTTFTVTATTNDGGTLTYQWQVSTNGGSSYTNVTNAGVYTGATTATLTISDTTGLDTYRYRCVVSSNGGAPNATSNAGVLTVA